MSKKHSIEEQCYYGYKVENNTDWSDFDPDCEYVDCSFYLNKGFSWLIRRVLNGKKHYSWAR